MSTSWTAGGAKPGSVKHSDRPEGLAPPLAGTILSTGDIPVVNYRGLPHTESQTDVQQDARVVPVNVKALHSDYSTGPQVHTYKAPEQIRQVPAQTVSTVGSVPVSQTNSEAFYDAADNTEEDEAKPVENIVGESHNTHHDVPIDALDPAGVRELRQSISKARHEQLGDDDIEKGEGVTDDPFNTTSKFDLELLLRNVIDEQLSRNNEPRELGVAFRDVTVTGYGVGAKLNETVGSMLLSPITILANLGNIFRPPVKYIINHVTGCVKPGEMLLVLGRPGAGCTTFLKSLASYRDGFRSIDGTVLYSGLDHKVIDGPLRGDVVYAPEDDIHFPTLTVGNTLTFATAARTPNAGHRIEYGGNNSRASYISLLRETIATILGLRHTYNTKVGNDFIRGVSGGERKRVSIGETFASRARIAMFDNSSRGLDSSTALEFTKALRVMTDVSRSTTLASIYQAGESLAQTFDKVVLFNEGQLVYFGPLANAADYFKSIGYLPQDRQTTADFLVACTDSRGRRLNPEFSGRIPLTAEEQARAFAESPAGKANAAEVDAYIAEMQSADENSNKKLVAAARSERAKRVSTNSCYLLSWPMQVRLAIKRRAQVALGDIMTQILVLIIITFQSFIIGSAYYNMGQTTGGMFPRGGVLFFAVLYNAFMAMSEITVSYTQRPIVIRQRRFAMLRPSADAIGVTLLDIPVRIVSLTVFCVIIYFLSGLSYRADKFFIFWAVVLLVTYTLVAFFRMTAALTRNESIATMIGGLAIIDVALYAGYAIPRPSMVVWWKWLSYCNPVSFSFEILMTNEFRGLEMSCVDSNGQSTLVPAGPGYENVSIANQVCPVAGSKPGRATVVGDDYLLQNYGYSWDHAGRNAGIVVAMFVFFVLVHMIATEFQTDPAAAGGVMVFRRNKKNARIISELRAKTTATVDPEALDTNVHEELPDEKGEKALEVSDEIFSWHNICYDIQIKSETRRLLDNVSGYVAPGKMTALMGESGAGKTTLLNVLAQRVSVGVVTGDFFVNGNTLPRSFQADAGYCQQQDIHLAQQTVREALQFSAMLRQSREIPAAERLAYVETVIDLLEMHSFADAIVGDVGEGLNVEQRKRLTIGVELAAKPTLLLFLDEPTSGLDAQAAWSIVRFLKKLAKNGQAILCTIHQPSGELFNQFDRLLLLKKGGKTVYFGDIGPNARTLLDYFEPRSGIKVGENDNPAEYILEAIGAGATATTDKDWAQLFKESQLSAELDASLREITANVKYDTESSTKVQREYAETVAMQVYLTTKRIFLAYWRSPSYIAGKLLLNVLTGLFVGSSYWGQGQKDSKIAVQNQAFSIFVVLAVAPPLAQQLQPIFMSMRSLYEIRERPSKMYRWYVFVFSTCIVEVPWNLFCGTLQWIPWYYMTQFDRTSDKSAYSWGINMIFQLHLQSLSQAAAAVAPNAMIASMTYATFFAELLIFCGVVQPPDQMPYFWRSWMFYLSPFTYIIEGLLGDAQRDKDIYCAPEEYNRVFPPGGQTCEQYLGNFSTLLGSGIEHGVGYFKDAADGNGCDYCSMRKGADYLASIKMDGSNRYRDIGILFAFTAFNFICVFAFYYIFRTAKWRIPWRR